MRIVYWAGILAAAVLCVAFAISNRPVVTLALQPLPFVVAMPLYLLVFAALLLGFVGGAIAAWIAGRHRRRTLRQCRRRIGALETELAALRPPPGGRDPLARSVGEIRAGAQLSALPDRGGPGRG
jgi:uncharacterized integral membrane protein